MADKKKIISIGALNAANPCRIEGTRTGKIAGVDADGRLLVDFPDSGLAPVSARLTSTAQEKLRMTSPLGRDVLLVFENNDPKRPVIIDTLYSLLDAITDQSADDPQANCPDEVTVDRKRILFDAEEEIVLRCGEASITLTRAGKIIIKGNYLLSRSSGANRIKGGSVRIN
jgi:hypothetical protein